MSGANNKYGLSYTRNTVPIEKTNMITFEMCFTWMSILLWGVKFCDIYCMEGEMLWNIVGFGDYYT